MFPRLELGARYTAVDNTVGLPGNPGFGTFKDKAFDAKLMLLQESTYLPAVSIGIMDFLGTKVFDARYAVMSKQFTSKSIGTFDLSLGVGTGRIDGSQYLLAPVPAVTGSVNTMDTAAIPRLPPCVDM